MRFVLALIFLVLLLQVTQSADTDCTGIPVVARLKAAQSCYATFIQDNPQANRQTWITSADCCANHFGTLTPPNGEPVRSSTHHKAEKQWCTVYAPTQAQCPIPISLVSDIPAQTQLEIFNPMGLYKTVTPSFPIQLKDVHFFQISNDEQKIKPGAPLVYDGSLLGVFASEVLFTKFFTPVGHTDLRETISLPEQFNLSFGSGFNASITRYLEHDDRITMTRYQFANSVGTTVHKYNEIQFKNGSIVTGVWNETSASGERKVYHNMHNVGGTYRADRVEYFSPDTELPYRVYRNWSLVNGQESYMFRHEKAVLKLDVENGHCNAFKVQDPDIEFPGRSYWLTAGHCLRGGAMTLISDQASPPLPVRSLSINYHDADWGILVSPETDGPSLGLSRQTLIRGPLTHLRFDHTTVRYKPVNAINILQPTFGLSGMVAVPGASGSPFTIFNPETGQREAIGIQSASIGDQRHLVVSKLPELSYYKKSVHFVWSDLDHPIQKRVILDDNRVHETIGFYIRDGIEYGEQWNFNDGYTQFTMDNWSNNNNGTLTADRLKNIKINDGSITEYVQYKRINDQKMASRKIEQFSGYKTTCYAHLANATHSICSRKVTKTPAGTTIESQKHVHSLNDDIQHSAHSMEVSADGVFSYFRNVKLKGSGEAISWDTGHVSDWE